MNESMGNNALRVMLWAVPRSASTVFTKFMSFVDDIEVWNEPYMLSFSNRQELLEMTKLLHDMYPEENRGNMRPLNTFSCQSNTSS